MSSYSTRIGTSRTRRSATEPGFDPARMVVQAALGALLFVLVVLNLAILAGDALRPLHHSIADPAAYFRLGLTLMGPAANLPPGFTP